MSQQPPAGDAFDPQHSTDNPYRAVGDPHYAAADPHRTSREPYRATGDPAYEGRGPAYVDSDERSMALVAHLSTIVALIVSAGWLSFVGPLVVWLIYKDRSDFVRRSAAGAFNFNIGLWLLSLLGWLCVITLIGAVIGIPILIFAAIAQIIFHIIGAMRANKGEVYNYPFQVRILR